MKINGFAAAVKTNPISSPQRNDKNIGWFFLAISRLDLL